MGVEAREARQPWILLSPALTVVTLLLIVPLAFIVVLFLLAADCDRRRSGRLLSGQLARSSQ